MVNSQLKFGGVIYCTELNWYTHFFKYILLVKVEDLDKFLQVVFFVAKLPLWNLRFGVQEAANSRELWLRRRLSRQGQQGNGLYVNKSITTVDCCHFHTTIRSAQAVSSPRQKKTCKSAWRGQMMCMHRSIELLYFYSCIELSYIYIISYTYFYKITIPKKTHTKNTCVFPIYAIYIYINLLILCVCVCVCVKTRGSIQKFLGHRLHPHLGSEKKWILWMAIFEICRNRKPVEVGSWNPIIYMGWKYIPGGWPWDFWLPSTEGHLTEVHLTGFFTNESQVASIVSSKTLNLVI